MREMVYKGVSSDKGRGDQCGGVGDVRWGCRLTNVRISIHVLSYCYKLIRNQSVFHSPTHVRRFYPAERVLGVYIIVNSRKCRIRTANL